LKEDLLKGCSVFLKKAVSSCEVTGFRVPVTSYPVVAGYRFQVAGVTGYRVAVARFWLLVAGYMFQVSGISGFIAYCFLPIVCYLVRICCTFATRFALCYLISRLYPV